MADEALARELAAAFGDEFGNASADHDEHWLRVAALVEKRIADEVRGVVVAHSSSAQSQEIAKLRAALARVEAERDEAKEKFKQQARTFVSDVKALARLIESAESRALSAEAARDALATENAVLRSAARGVANELEFMGGDGTVWRAQLVARLRHAATPPVNQDPPVCLSHSDPKCDECQPMPFEQDTMTHEPSPAAPEPEKCGTCGGKRWYMANGDTPKSCPACGAK